MRIHDIIIDNIRGLEHLELGPLPDDGVIIVYGDNEAGKSTIFDALDALLTTGHGSKSKDIKALKPIGRDASPRVSVRMTLGETSLTATKQWLKGKMSELEIHAPQHAHYTAREADDKLAELLREHVDDSLMKTLFVRQDSLDANVAAAGIPSLQRALSGTDGDGDVDVAEDDALIAVVTDEYLRYFTKTGKHNAQFTGLEEQARQAEEELHHARHVHRHLQYHVDRVGQLEAHRAIDLEELPGAKAELEQARLAAEEASQSEQQVAEAQAAFEAAAKERDAAAEKLDARHALQDELKKAEADREKAALVLESAKSKASKDRAQFEAKSADLARAKETYKKEIEVLKARRVELQILEDRSELETLEGIVGKLDYYSKRLAEVRKRVAGVKVTGKDVKAAEVAKNELDVATKFRDTVMPRLEMTSLSETSVEVDGDARTVGQEPLRVELREGTSVRSGDLTIVYRAGVSSGHNPDQDVERAQEKLERILEPFGCETVEQLTEIFGQSQRDADTVRDLQHQVDALLGGRKEDVLRAQYEQLKQESKAPVDPSVTVEEAKRAVEDSEARRAAAERNRDVAAELLEPWQSRTAAMDEVRASTEHDNAVRKAQEATAKLTDAEKVRATTQLGTDLEAAQAAVIAASKALDQAKTSRDEADPAGKENLYQAALARVESLEQRIHEAEKDLDRLSGRIEQAEGAAEDVAVAQARFDAVSRELRSFTRRAQAAELLRNTLLKHQAEAREKYAEPFVTELSQLAKAVFGPTVGFQLDDHLGIAQRTVNGKTVPLEALSGGAKEQLAIMVRFAIASLITKESAGKNETVPVIVDDVLGATDPNRLKAMGHLFATVGKRNQVIVLTCYPQRYDWVADKKSYPIAQLKGAALTS